MSLLKRQYLLFFSAFLFFLFFKLGYNSLWDDEANTALFGKSVWLTGDSNALLDNNLIAFREVLELKNLKNRLIPPLQYYFVSPTAGLADSSYFNSRTLFALIASICLLGMLLWLKMEKMGTEKTILFLFCLLQE